MFRYRNFLIIFICSLLLTFLGPAIADAAITRDTPAKVRVQTIMAHGEIAMFKTTVGGFKKIFLKHIVSKYAYARSFLVVLENKTHAEAFHLTSEHLNYHAKFKAQKGYIFKLQPIEPIMPKVMNELKEYGFTEDAKMYLLSVEFKKDFSNAKDKVHNLIPERHELKNKKPLKIKRFFCFIFALLFYVFII